MSHDLGPKFELGRVVITQGAKATLPPEDVHAAIHRHARGDWGELDEPDIAANERALLDGDRLVSVYSSTNGVRFYVITEWDRSFTTILLPDEY
ncbi:MAG: hypothetical protein L0387_19380 [Acidobacteria bacterium]|nr:hypothetical protein [Acidobacteriota bacterium]